MSTTDPQRAALDQAFTFAVYCLGSRTAALAVLQTALELAEGDLGSLDSVGLLRLVRDAIARAPGARSRPASETLPAVWHGELTRDLPGDLVADPARTAALAGALRRICFTAVLRSVAETPRCAFVLRHVLGLPEEAVARVLQQSRQPCGPPRSSTPPARAAARPTLRALRSGQPMLVPEPAGARACRRLALGGRPHSHDRPHAVLQRRARATVPHAPASPAHRRRGGGSA